MLRTTIFPLRAADSLRRVLAYASHSSEAEPERPEQRSLFTRSLSLQQAFGLRREECIKFRSRYTDRGESRPRPRGPSAVGLDRYQLVRIRGCTKLANESLNGRIGRDGGRSLSILGEGNGRPLSTQPV